jgi:hypothetical protein
MKETFQKEALSLLKEIDIDDPEYREIDVFISPENEDYMKTTEIKSSTLLIKEKYAHALINDQIVKMHNLPHHDFKYAVFERESDQFIVIRINDRYFLIKSDDLETLFNQIVEKSKISNK